MTARHLRCVAHPLSGASPLSNPVQIRLLLVDDNEDDRRWITRLLSEAGVLDGQSSVAEAECLADAVALVEQRDFDLCIVDWELPDGTGIELAQDARIAQGHLPVVVITGNERPEQGSFAVVHGAADFLPKDDLTPRTLARACTHALARSQLERQIEVLRQAEQSATEREHTARVAAESALVEERRARERVSALHALSSMLGSATTTKDIVTTVVQLFWFERASGLGLHLLRDDVLHLERSSGLEQRRTVEWASLPLTEASPLTHALRRGAAGHIAPEFLAQERGLAAPIATRSGLLGLLTVIYPAATPPGPDELSYVELVAQHTAQALQRARLYELAQQSAEFEERLLSVVGHDLRTPLSAIVMVTQLLKMQDPESEQVARLERSSQRMTELITDVLDRAAVRRGAPSQREMYTTDLESLLHDQIDELRTALPESQIKLEVDGPVPVRCEPSRTSQIIANLVRNAVQHGRPGAPVAVALKNHPIGAAISVHNHGTPISAEELPHLFEPFKRGQRAAGSGTGLGLFIVHESAAALGGGVDVTSDATGTTFTVTLPRTPSGGAEVGNASPP